MFKKLLFVLFFLFSYLYAQEIKVKKVITFAPLPVSKKSDMLEDFLPLFNYIEQHSKIKTKFIYEKDYSSIIEKFKKNEIDIALLGPLPYLKLNQIDKFNEPIIVFKQNNGKAYYRCVLAKFGKDKINFDDTLKVALTQPLSTCGYYMTNILLKENYSVNLKEQKYAYTMSHYNAIIGVLDGDFNIAGVKNDIADDFASLGLRVISKSSYLPGFSLIANTRTLSKKQIETIQKLILSIDKSTYEHWKGISSNGFNKANKDIYQNLKINFETIPNVGNIK